PPLSRGRGSGTRSPSTPATTLLLEAVVVGAADMEVRPTRAELVALGARHGVADRLLPRVGELLLVDVAGVDEGVEAVRVLALLDVVGVEALLDGAELRLRALLLARPEDLDGAEGERRADDRD